MSQVREVVGTNLLLYTNFKPKFQTGAIVRLKSGSPNLTVVDCDHESVSVHYYVKTSLHGATHPLNAVELVRKGTKSAVNG